MINLTNEEKAIWELAVITVLKSLYISHDPSIYSSNGQYKYDHISEIAFAQADSLIHARRNHITKEKTIK